MSFISKVFQHSLPTSKHNQILCYMKEKETAVKMVNHCHNSKIMGHFFLQGIPAEVFIQSKQSTSLLHFKAYLLDIYGVCTSSQWSSHTSHNHLASSAFKISGLCLYPLQECDHHKDNPSKKTEAATVEIAIGFAKAVFERNGYESGGGSMHSSPLK